MASKFKDKAKYFTKDEQDTMSYNGTYKQTAGTLTHGLVYY